MKKILFILIVIVFLFSCENKGCSNEIVEFTHNGVLTYYLDENPKDALKKIKLKILSNKKENLLSLDHQDIKVEKFSFDKCPTRNSTKSSSMLRTPNCQQLSMPPNAIR